MNKKIINAQHPIVLMAMKEFAEIESMLILHGGDTNALFKKAKKLSQTTTMTLKEAVIEILAKDSKKREKPIGLLGFLNKK